MTDKTTFDGKKAFRCEECKMHYHNRRVAEECEKYCRKNDACKSEIIRKSMEKS